MTRSGPVMAQLAQARSGDRAELDELMPVVCRELRACPARETTPAPAVAWTHSANDRLGERGVSEIGERVTLADAKPSRGI